MKRRKNNITYLILIGILFFGFSGAFLCSAQGKKLLSLLKQLETYEEGENDNLVLELNAYIRSHRATKEQRLECERQLLSFLKTNASETAKMLACRHLRIIGTKESIPVLKDMLLKKETTDMARYALEKIPDRASDKALLSALHNSSGLIKAGIISSLGHRKVSEAVPSLKEILNENTGSSLSLAAAAALGHIGNSGAADALSLALSQTEGELKVQVAGSLLKCAEQYLSDGDNEQAAHIYDRILTADLPSSLHNSAVRGKINAAGEEGTKYILEALKNKEKEINPSCIEMIPECFDSSNIASVCALLPTLPPSAKAQLISVLSLYPDKGVRQAVLDSAQNSSPAVRIASLKTLKQIGDSSTVAFLAQYAASSQGEDQQQARISLLGLKGDGIDSTIISNLNSEKTPEIQIEYLKALEQRQVYSGKDVVFETLSSSIPEVRLQAIKSIKQISSPGDIPRLLEFLIKTENDTDREEMINTIAFTALKIQDPLHRGESVKTVLPQVQDPRARSSLYLLLGRIGDDSTLPVLRSGLSEKNEMVHDSIMRAFASWPTSTAAEDVLYIAETSNKPEYRILCLRAYIRMVEMEPYQRPEAAVRSLENALNLTERVQEKVLILGALQKFPCDRAANVTERLTKDGDVEQEAKKTLVLIKDKLKKGGE